MNSSASAPGLASARLLRKVHVGHARGRVTNTSSTLVSAGKGGDQARSASRGPAPPRRGWICGARSLEKEPSRSSMARPGRSGASKKSLTLIVRSGLGRGAGSLDRAARGSAAPLVAGTGRLAEAARPARRGEATPRARAEPTRPRAEGVRRAGRHGQRSGPRGRRAPGAARPVALVARDPVGAPPPPCPGRRRTQQLLLLGVADEGDLDQHRGHGRAHQDPEGRLLHAAALVPVAPASSSWMREARAEDSSRCSA